MGKLDRLNSLFRKTGFEVTRYNKGTNGLLRRKAMIERHGIDLIFDVGANTGIYGKEMREIGYRGRIVSFEPLTHAFERLLIVASNDSQWEVNNFALGNENTKQLINISANSHSSSILEILETHTTAEASASYVGKQEIEIITLDSVFNDICKGEKEILLKIDTQGFELNVLKGAETSLQHINTIQLEMSLRPLYVGQPLYHQLMDFLHSCGYALIDIEPGFADSKTGTLLQFDGVFRKTSFIN
jgi:FkbM family methyltransferase